MTIGTKVKYGNLRGTIFLIIYPTMRAVVRLGRNGAVRLVDMDELEEVSEK